MNDSTRPPNQPPTPPPPPAPRPSSPNGVTATLDRIDAVLQEQLFVAVDVILLDIQTPAHRDRFSAAVGADAIATTGGPVTFSLPPTPAPPRFTEGEHRLVGRVGDPDEAEAEALARLITAAACACRACNP